MDAYYYAFDETDCLDVDKILSAVAWAGKMYHHTEGWVHEDPSEIDLIQCAANKCAARITQLEEAIEDALRVANGRWDEWGSRAFCVGDILEKALSGD